MIRNTNGWSPTNNNHLQLFRYCTLHCQFEQIVMKNNLINAKFITLSFVYSRMSIMKCWCNAKIQSAIVRFAEYLLSHCEHSIIKSIYSTFRMEYLDPSVVVLSTTFWIAARKKPQHRMSFTSWPKRMWLKFIVRKILSYVSHLGRVVCYWFCPLTHAYFVDYD